MKVFTILVLAAFAIALVTASPTWKQQSSLEDENDNNDSQQSQRHHHQVNGQLFDQTSPHSADSSNDSDEKWNQQQQQQRRRQQLNRHQSNEDNDDASGANWTDVQPFRAKITRRLEESGQLSNQPEIKRKIMKIVDDKLDACRITGAGSMSKADRHCLGRATGHIMQLIAAFENGSRDLPGSYDF